MMNPALAREWIKDANSYRFPAVDVDHFKRFNDTYGHELGDRLLGEVGKFFNTNLRADDIACRYGGEEFTLILPDAALEGAAKRADALRHGAAQLSIPVKGGGAATITISIGVAIYPEHGETPEALLQAADAALYRAKAEGRDRLVTAHSPVTA